MKKISLILILILTSCSFFNNKKVSIAIESSPSQAEIYINDQFYGITPIILEVEPKEMMITLHKRGYGLTNFKPKIYTGSIRTDVDNKVNADGVRCLLDMVSVVFSFQAYLGKCADFHQKNHKIIIPQNYDFVNY
jgi:hypothetical protein